MAGGLSPIWSGLAPPAAIRTEPDQKLSCPTMTVLRTKVDETPKYTKTNLFRGPPRTPLGELADFPDFLAGEEGVADPLPNIPSLRSRLLKPQTSPLA